MIDFSNFLMLRLEGGLIAVLLILLIYDIFASGKSRKWLHLIACILFGVHTAIGFLPQPEGVAFGGMFLSSPMTALMKNILNLGCFIVLLQAGAWLRREDTVVRQGEFYVVLLTTMLGLYLMASATNFMLLYLGIETSSLPLACLAAWNKHRRKSAEAGTKYILIAAFSSGVMMFGLSYLYGVTGSMYFADMSVRICWNPMLILGFTFFLTGLAFKISLVPFHLWTADVYEGAPTPVTAFLSVVSKGAACFALLFALYRVFGQIEAVWHGLLWGLSVVTIIIGNLFALRQKELKRFFAYSSISQAGYIMLGVMGGSVAGMASTVYYVFVYLFSNLAAFGVITVVENSTGRTDISMLNGLYRFNPRLSIVMTLAIFSLAGIPPLAGFFSKFFVFAAAAANGDYLLVFIALVNTVLSLYYYLLIIKAIFITSTSDPVGCISTDGFNRLSIIVCVIAILLTGLISCIYNGITGISFF